MFILAIIYILSQSEKMMKLKLVLGCIYIVILSVKNDQIELHLGPNILVNRQSEQNDQTEVHFGLYIYSKPKLTK